MGSEGGPDLVEEATGCFDGVGGYGLVAVPEHGVKVLVAQGTAGGECHPSHGNGLMLGAGRYAMGLWSLLGWN